MIILHNEAKIFEDKKTPIIVMSRDRSYFQKITYTQSFFFTSDSFARQSLPPTKGKYYEQK